METKHYSVKIKEVRERLGMSQEEFANKCGHNSDNARSWASKVESGRIKLSLDDATTVANALDISPLSLLDLDNVSLACENASKIDLNNEEVNLIRQYKKLSNNGKEKLLERLSELTKLEGL